MTFLLKGRPPTESNFYCYEKHVYPTGYQSTTPSCNLLHHGVGMPIDTFSRMSASSSSPSFLFSASCLDTGTGFEVEACWLTFRSIFTDTFSIPFFYSLKDIRVIKTLTCDLDL